MRRLTGNEVIWISVIAWVAFIPLYQAVTFGYISHQKFTNVAHALAMGAAFTVWLQWIPAVRRAIAAGYSSGADMMSVSVWALMGVLIYMRVYSIVVLTLDRPPWLMESFMLPIAPWALFGALVMMIFAPGTKQGEIPLRNYGWFLFAGVFGALITGISIGLSIADFAQ